ncbi:fimbria/pilus periplasmic chaperone, partial [Salmonella enterica subsp. enterica serovar Montevideo]|nr:fimbria/pilus periplasmic chaperone [Salmonella enterica subsp. enterica serovar Montevideo]
NVIVTQHPGERHLRQFLAPSRSQFIQLANFFQFVGGNLFWFNVRGVPPKPEDDNVLQLAMQSQLKLFYRPKAIIRSSND